MRSIVLYALTIALTFAPAYGQTVFELVKASDEGDLRPAHKAQALTVLEQVRTSAERGLFPEGLPAAESRLPDGASAETGTDFTVRGSGGADVNLPYPLTVGTWTASLTISGSDSYEFWLENRSGSNTDRQVLFCASDIACPPGADRSRKDFRMERTRDDLRVEAITWTGTWAIRFVKHASTPSPDPDPSPGPCTPTTDVLQFDGGYGVRMCYVTGEGETGQAQAGVWASSQSGILWFFSRENAEVLVKVLDGCEYNGHRWVFVAPVTDVGFELRVTAPDGETWTHTNEAGTTASTRSDTSAFRCR